VIERLNLDAVHLFRRRGVGRIAMQAIIAEAERAGLWKLVSRVFLDNQASRGLIAACGFREVGVYKNHGKLDGEWRDVLIVECLIPANLR
jgi:L-amino acid N-acyltransferase YncA